MALASIFSNFNAPLFPTAPEWAIFCDFDETWYAHQSTKRYQEALEKCERMIFEQAESDRIIVGWITGSSLDSVVQKMGAGGLKQLPHFIASDLGTEICYTCRDRSGRPDADWNRRLAINAFHSSYLELLLRRLSEAGINLIAENQKGASRYRRHFYYRQKNRCSDLADLQRIKREASKYRICAKFNRCNPKAGDPSDCYDVDFFPACTGKASVVKFMLERFGLTPKNGIAFGDSGNDLDMLRAVRYGYLVGNATIEARENYSLICDDDYVIGICKKVGEILGLSDSPALRNL